MSAYLSPVGNDNLIDTNGDPLTGGKIYTYLAGTSTPAPTYTDSTGATPQANPIILDSRGVPSSPIWLGAGVAMKFVITDANGVTLPPTFDNILGIGDPANVTAQDQWVVYAGTPTYISATSFSVAGDQTATFQVARRLKTTNSGGTIYSSITIVSFAAGVTTVTVVNESGTLDSGLSAVSYGLLSIDSTSLPKTTLITAIGATATTSGANIDINDIPPYVKRITICFMGVSTNGTSNWQVQGGDSGGIEGSGYLGSVSSFAAATAASAILNSGFGVTNSVAATTVLSGQMILTLGDSSTNTWSSICMVGASDAAGTQIGAASKSFSAPLDRLRLTTTAGLNTFDLGKINVICE